MPTGYTYKINEGITFEQFALDCARAFGALVTLRDDPDAEIPDKFEPSNWHQKQLEEAGKELDAIVNLTRKEIEERIDREYQEELSKWEKSEKERKELADKYCQMMAEVDAWTPPTPDHAGLKEFMQKQLVDSLRWDCSSYDKPIKLSYDQWVFNKGADYARDILYHEKEHQKEIERTNQRNEWVKQLKESLA